MTRRERLLILAVVPLAALVLGQRLVWQPLAEARAEARADIATYRTLQAAAATADAAPPPRDPGPLGPRISRSAEAAGLTVQRLTPEGARLAVTLADAPFDTVVAWLATLETQAVLVSLDIERRPAPGTVATRAVLR